VDGQTWQLRLAEAGPTWVPADSKVTKDASYVEVGDLGRPPPAAASGADTELVSFSEQVPSSQRLTLRQHVETFGKDEIFHPDRERPPTLEDRDASQSAVIFHPKTIQMLKFKADLLSTQAEDLTEAAQESKRQRREHQKKQEEISMDSELQALTALQQGAHEVKTLVGADALRRVDLQQFRTFLKRKHEESGMTVSYDALASAQTTQAKALEANQALDAEFRARRMALKPLEVASFSVWPPELQRAWQGNLFAPSSDPQGPEQYDMGSPTSG